MDKLLTKEDKEYIQLEMSEHVKSMSINFAKWLRGQIIPLYVYDDNDMWEVFSPSKMPTEQKFISSDELYNLFLESIK